MPAVEKINLESYALNRQDKGDIKEDHNKTKNLENEKKGPPPL